MDEPEVSSSARHHNAQDVVDHGRARRDAALGHYQPAPVQPATSVDRGTGLAFSSWGVPCLIPALRNVRLPKDFKGPRKVPKCTDDLPPEAWIESYEMAMELLEVNDAACAKYFTMMLDGTARTWLKGLPPNSIGSWAELKARFIQNSKIHVGNLCQLWI